MRPRAKLVQSMGAKLQVKAKRGRALAWLAVLVLGVSVHAAEPPPDARAILRDVRASQALQHETLRGQLRNGPTVIPFRLVFGGDVIKYEFTNPPSTIVLRMREKESQLSEVTKGGAERISGARFSDSVRDTDISYEDLSMRFLYWSRATVQGEETKLISRRCWVILVEPPQVNDSQYSRVKLWVDKENGALLQAEAFDKAGKFARRFVVRSGQKIAGAWYLKQMRIEAPAGAKKDKLPTYLEIEAVEKS